MWCRAMLATIAFTYIVCVLILNGLQKEDLDVSTLKKLQRYNLNIDDMNNETLRKECETATRHSSTTKLTDVNNSESLKIIPSDKSTNINDDQMNKLSDSSLRNIIINYFNTIQKTSKTNDSDKEKNDEPKPSTESANIEKFIKLWNKLKTKQDSVVESTAKAIESFTATIQRTTRSNTRSDDENLEYIKKILENFIAIQKITTTIRPTTKQVDYDYIAQKIKEILANTNNQNKQKIISTEREKYVTNKVNEGIEVLHNDSIQYIKLSTIFGPMIDRNASNTNVHFNDKNVSYQTESRYMVEDGPIQLIADSKEKQHYKNMGIKHFSEDIIREISESVKAKVLQDLKHVIITTTKKPRTTTKFTTVKTTTTTTVRPTVAPTTANTKLTEKLEALDVLDKIMEMFQQLKTSKATVPTSKKFTQASIKTAYLAYPYTIAGNMFNNNIKSNPVNITSVIINPFNSISTPLIQTAISQNEPYTLLNINTHNLPIGAKPVHKITQFNIFNTKNNYHTSPITIQTNSVEVPPLGLPARQSVIYQNIVITTKHPFENIKKDNRHRYTTNDGKHYDDKKYTAEQHKNLYNGFGFGKHERNRDREFINNEYYKETKRKPIKYEDYGRSNYNDHNIERFHEKLERADYWPRITGSKENKDDYSTAKLISRHQLPLNGGKKRSRYDDAHFRSFLKTQQKVNDMLERILATKTIDGPQSVETTV